MSPVRTADPRLTPLGPAIEMIERTIPDGCSAVLIIVAGEEVYVGGKGIDQAHVAPLLGALAESMRGDLD